MFQFPRQTATTAERLAAALSYLGFGPFLILLWSRGHFVTSHARLALSLHISRILLCGVGLGAWFFYNSASSSNRANDLLDWLWHLIALTVIGLPKGDFGGDARLLFFVPAALIWLIDLLGATAALQGRGLPWDLPHSVPSGLPPITHTPTEELEERARLRRLRDQRLTRMRYATTTAASERQREQRITECKHELGAHMIRLDQLNHMMATGEISANHYQQLATNVRAEMETLREELHLLGARVAAGLTERPATTNRLAHLGSQLQAQTLSLSFIDLTGVPLFTYGHFPLDEALVAGMLSAFNSLSQEVFGSPMHKTQLAEGQVLFFVHGQWCVLMTLFDAEPSPAQIARLEGCLKTFESNNTAELQRNPVSPARLRPIDIDFDFAQPA